ncbi:Complex I subunit NDUFS6 isoform 1 [Hibiscus syriacus]|uniref:Complex I subunit NDUFS6 isoform 1 n=1 Tax=Hibiscus syriacus TaxID=106335 RepID=A0A6A2YQG2_HIBSY|nr:Complex I subunit NDUFS6 isoform 1 [Hibiscus syriacus]
MSLFPSSSTAHSQTLAKLVISDKRTVNAMGGKTARACNGCLLKRARWYCSASDAFLCQIYDTLVHSANQLAYRHTRVQLETSSSKLNPSVTAAQDDAPTWNQGFTRKTSTPRQNKAKLLNLNPIDPLVPDVGCEDGSGDENDKQLICRVFVFYPFSADLENENGNLVVDGFMPSDLDLNQFAADVESLLGIDLLDCKRKMKGSNHKEGTGGICSMGKRNIMDGEREARVSRYREKRRRRLLLKKIRYRVRKLNAEKRPRFKGSHCGMKTTVKVVVGSSNSGSCGWELKSQVVHLTYDISNSLRSLAAMVVA